MSSDKVSIFLTGATGYIGGSILQRLLAHPNAKNFEISTLVRNADKAKKLESEFGVKVVVGSLADLDKLTSLAENAHVVFQVADCDDLNAINAILKGLKARHEKTGDVPILIHTSGAAALGDDAQGAFASEKVYSDLKVADIEALPPYSLHRPADSLITSQDAAGYVRTHIVMPAFVYGVPTGVLFDAGISNPHTVASWVWVNNALKTGVIPILGTAVSIWGNAHIDDLADLYIKIFDADLTNPEKVSHGREGYFFGSNDENTIGSALQVVADELYALGKISSPKLVQYSMEEIGKYYGNEFFARLFFANTRAKSERGQRELGWAPTHTTADLVEELKAEVGILVKKPWGQVPTV
ncbi:NAD-P-binding protein [Lenzites betulinus]|nr:NAD-P-binding protein [Lenzites betulinus]